MNATRPAHERGAALLGVLLLVAIMAVLSSLMLDRLGLATRLAGNLESSAAARRALAEGEVRLLADLRDSRREQGQGMALGMGLGVVTGGAWPVPRGRIAWSLGPGGNCFNVNALVELAPDGTLRPRPAGLLELSALMASLGLAPDRAGPLAAAMADWIDSDALALPDGAEDAAYARGPQPYRTAGRALVTVGELRAVRGMAPALYARLAPWLCALPEVGTSPVALSSLAPGQGRLLTMFAPDALPVARAEQLIAQAPRGGYADDRVPVPGLGMGEVVRSDRWLRATLVATIDSQAWQETVLIDAGQPAPTIVARQWGEPADR